MGKLHELAKYLYEHETITGEEFMKILNDPLPSVNTGVSGQENAEKDSEENTKENTEE